LIKIFSFFFPPPDSISSAVCYHITGFKCFEKIKTNTKGTINKKKRKKIGIF